MHNDNESYLWKRRHEIKVRALTNRIYYQERQRIYENREGFIKATSILVGSFAFAKVADPDTVKWCAAIITGASTFSLVFSFGNKARDSAERSVEWAQLERDIDKQGERDFTEEHINQWFARANDIEAGESAVHKALFEICYERAVAALGGHAEIKLSLFDRFLPNI